MEPIEATKGTNPMRPVYLNHSLQVGEQPGPEAGLVRPPVLLSGASLRRDEAYSRPELKEYLSPMVRITQEELWAKIPYWVLTDPNLDSYAVRVYCVLSKHANWTTRHSAPGVRKIAEEAHCSTNTVLKALTDLETYGCVVVTREKHGNRHKVNQYHLPIIRVSPHETPTSDVVSHPARQGVSPRATPDVSPGATELDPQNEITRRNDLGLKPPREPGESRAAYARRLAET